MPYDSNLPRSRKVFPVGVRALAIVVPVSSAAKLIVFASALALAAFNALAQRATKVDPANSKIVIVYGSDSVVWAGLVFVQFDRADVAAGAIDGIGHPGLVDRFRNSTLVEIERLARFLALIDYQTPEQRRHRLSGAAVIEERSHGLDALASTGGNKHSSISVKPGDERASRSTDALNRSLILWRVYHGASRRPNHACDPRFQKILDGPEPKTLYEVLKSECR